MSDDSDLMKLYSQRILALAADIPHLGALPTPMGQANRRAPLCGSTVRVDLELADGRVSGFAQDVKACALGQAAAAVLGANVLGASRAQLQSARDQLKAMLTQDGPAPAAPFEGLEVLLPAREYRNRHGSILLALEATLEAFDQAASAAA